MDYELDAGGQGRLGSYFSEIGEALKNKTRRSSFAVYAMGLFGERGEEERRAAARPRIRIGSSRRRIILPPILTPVPRILIYRPQIFAAPSRIFSALSRALIPQPRRSSAGLGF
jgi:hypothetical protein